jgi:predicted P-loop ATPase
MEAVVRFRRGDPWWLDTTELNQEAAAEQDARYAHDPWETAIAEKLLKGKSSETTVNDLLKNAIGLSVEQQEQYHANRVACLQALGWRKVRRRTTDGGRQYVYKPLDPKKWSATPRDRARSAASYDRCNGDRSRARCR